MNFAINYQSTNLNLVKESPPSEQQLINLLVANDRRAQKELYQTYYGKMVCIPMRYTSNKEEAYEILNDAFMKVFKSIKNYIPSGQFSGWIAKIVLHTTLDHVRKKYRYDKKVDQYEPKILSVENDALSNLGLQEIYEKIQLLPDASRAVFSMFVIDGYSHKEICEELGISIGTSKWHLSNARQKLQKLLNF